VDTPKLFMLLLGCRPKGRLTEQHDIFFGIANDLKDLIPDINSFWPEAKNNIHIDAWREVNYVDGYNVAVVSRVDISEMHASQLYFFNLGGYKRNEFDEFHYKMMIVANDRENAIMRSKQTAFYKHTGFKGAPAHVDDKYGIDVDDMYAINDILAKKYKEKYTIVLSENAVGIEDEIHLGYLPLYKI
jgi:hypothetical protein